MDSIYHNSGNGGFCRCGGLLIVVTLYKIYHMRKSAVLTIVAVMIFSSAFSRQESNSMVRNENNVANLRPLIAGFDFFRIHRQGRFGVTATWGFTATSETVTGFVVERTYDDPADPYANWQPAGVPVAPGQRSYKSTDTNVAPGFLSYRVKAFIGGANSYTVYSAIETIHIVAH